MRKFCLVLMGGVVDLLVGVVVVLVVVEVTHGNSLDRGDVIEEHVKVALYTSS
jgi:hypothetical protein